MKVKDKVRQLGSGLVNITAPSGHRQTYLDLFERLLTLQPSVGGLWHGNLVRLLSADHSNAGKKFTHIMPLDYQQDRQIKDQKTSIQKMEYFK